MELQDFAPLQFFSRLAFSPAASIIDRRGETAQAMLDFLELTDLSMHPTAVEVASDDQREEYRIGLIQIYASLTGFDDFEGSCARVSDFLRMAVDHLDPPDIEAIDVRTVEIAPAESFEGLRDRLADALVCGLGGMKGAIGVGLTDAAWAFEFGDDDVAGRVQFGPMTADELGEILQVNGDLEAPPNMLFLRVDAKFPDNRQDDPIDRWKTAVARQRGIAERMGSWLKEMVA